MVRFGISRASRGFTLIEILLVVGIIAILASAVTIALNPARQFAQARNTQRQANIEAILNAVGQNIVDHKGVFSCDGVTVGTATSSIGTATGNANLDSCLQPYLPAGIPLDPGSSVAAAGTVENTGYTVSYDATAGRYLVCAPNANEPSLASPGALCVRR